MALTSIVVLLAFAGNYLFDSARIQYQLATSDLAIVAAADLEQPLMDYAAGADTRPAMRQILEQFYANKPDVNYVIYDAGYRPLVSRSGSLPPDAEAQADPEVFEALRTRNGQGAAWRASSAGNESLFLAVRVQYTEEVYGVLRLESPADPALAGARRTFYLLLAVALALAAGLSVFGFLLARTLSDPLEALTQAAASLSQGNLRARVPAPRSPEELRRLAEAFNVMAARLQGNLDELRAFVANASHELRTPLTSIKLRVEALREGAMEDPQVAGQFLEEVEGEVDRLSMMVNDLLDLSRIEAGMASRQRASINLAALASEVCAAFRPRAERSQIELTCQAADGLGAVSGNEDQLRRMLTNLIDNAIKYNVRGGRVEVRLEPGERPQTLLLSVRDTGVGISPAHLQHIFERFYRVEATRPRAGLPHGSGLGLAIARSIVESHGGRIGVESEVGAGAVFMVELPVGRAPATRAAGQALG